MAEYDMTVITVAYATSTKTMKLVPNNLSSNH